MRTARIPLTVAGGRLPAALFALTAATVLLAGCSDSVAAPRADVEPSEHRTALGATAVPRWNEILQGLVIKNRPSAPAAFRQFAYLSLAQYAAVVSAERAQGAPRPSVDGAVAGASAAVLAYLYPGDAAALEDSVRAGQPADVGGRKRFAAGEAAGRAVAAQVIARATGDNFNLPFTGTIPTGPGYWYSSAVPAAAPLLPRLGEMRPFFLSSGSQLRPPAPPAFGSPAYLEALAELRQIAATRTPEQVRIAQYWALPAGTVSPAGYWNQVAVGISRDKWLSERRAAQVLALMNAAMTDAIIATHEAKYTYWLVRPSQADAGVTLAIGLPNHPSYPSNHSAISTAAATVLGGLFPAERDRVTALAEEAGMSRLYGGIHYRFDFEAGKKMGRAAGRIALRQGQASALLRMVESPAN